MVLFIGYVFMDSVLAEAASDTIIQSGDWGYTVAGDGTAVINKYYGVDLAVEVPDEVDGFCVTKLGNSVFSGRNLSSVVLPNSVTSIGAWAFMGCSDLTSVSLSENLTSIGAYAFDGCSNLTSITIPSSLKSIGIHAFHECNKLKNVYITDLDAWCKISRADFYSNPLCNIASLYLEGEKLRHLIIPDGFWKIENWAFWGCGTLTDVVFPNSVSRIGERAFGSCTNLKNITLPNGVTDILPYAFAGCSSLTNVTLPDSVSYIARGAFSNCSNLRDIVWPKELEIISENTFSDCSNLINIVIPNNVTEIERCAFFGCGSLSEVIIPPSVLRVDESAFARCYDLTIYGEKDSYIQTYATNNAIPFKYMYSIIYDANGGTEAPAKQTKLEDKSVNLSEDEPYYAEHIFLGWATCPAGDVEYLPRENYSENHNLELYAVWDPGHTVTYDANGGTSAPATQKKYYGETLVLSDVIPERAGYRFLGWSASPDGTVCYLPSSNYSEETDITLYAIWERLYIVSYDANGGTGAPNTQTKTEGKTLVLSGVLPNRAGYRFLGWSTSPDSDVCYMPSSHYTEDSDVTLYAVWEPIYTVSYNANGGYDAPASQVQRKGEPLVLASTIPYKSEYVFLGWSTSKDGAVLYANGATYREESDITLYAKWGTFECSKCEGTGEIQEECDECKGYGTIKEPSVCVKCSGTGSTITAIDKWLPCPICNGNKANCEKCHGVGEVYDPEYVKIPCSQCDETGIYYSIKNCPICHCQGKVFRQCDQCNNGSTQKTFNVQYYIDHENVFLKQTKYGGVALALSYEVPVHLGVQFLGWATSPDGRIEYYPGDTYLENKDLQLYAVWSGNIPSAPTVLNYTDTKVTLIPIAGGEYSLDGISWQTSNVFENLSPSTKYTFYQRYAKTDTNEASVSSRGTTVTTDKSKQTLIPNAPTVHSVTDSSITLVAVNGCEYSLDGITWQTSNVFEGLSCGTKYIFYQRYKETFSTYAGNRSEGASFRTDKGTQSAPSKPTLLSKTYNTVTLVSIDGYEYSMDGITWQKSNIFTGLNPETNYLFYQRKAETDTRYASEASDALTIKTKEMFESMFVSTPPYKTTYLEGEEELDVTGGELTLCYADGTIEKIKITDDMVIGFDCTMIGSQTLIVSFEGKTATFTVEVTVKPKISTWKHDGIGWWYQNSDGTYPASCWKNIDNVWYYFNPSGYIVTGWQSIGGTWYYFNGSGAMVTDWQSIGGTWYYFNGSGAMVTGWQSIGGTWYYLNGSGAMVTGWQSIGGIWYYFNGSGAMVSGQWVGNYYLQSDGSMATNKWIGSYYVDADGAWIP